MSPSVLFWGHKFFTGRKTIMPRQKQCPTCREFLGLMGHYCKPTLLRHKKPSGPTLATLAAMATPNKATYRIGLYSYYASITDEGVPFEEEEYRTNPEGH